MEVSFREIIVAFIFSHPVGWGGVGSGGALIQGGASVSPPFLGATGAAASHKREEEAEAEVSVEILDSACLLSLLGPSG